MMFVMIVFITAHAFSIKATSDHDDDVDDVGENDNDGQNISATLN